MSEIPDEFRVEYSKLLRSYSLYVYRRDADGQWFGQTDVYVGPLGWHLPPEPMDEEHARHLYETYDATIEAQ